MREILIQLMARMTRQKWNCRYECIAVRKSCHAKIFLSRIFPHGYYYFIQKEIEDDGAYLQLLLEQIFRHGTYKRGKSMPANYLVLLASVGGKVDTGCGI